MGAQVKTVAYPAEKLSTQLAKADELMKDIRRSTLPEEQKKRAEVLGESFFDIMNKLTKRQPVDKAKQLTAGAVEVYRELFKIHGDALEEKKATIGGVVFTSWDLKMLTSVANTKEKWKAIFHDDGMVVVRNESGQATLKGGMLIEGKGINLVDALGINAKALVEIKANGDAALAAMKREALGKRQE